MDVKPEDFAHLEEAELITVGRKYLAGLAAVSDRMVRMVQEQAVELRVAHGECTPEEGARHLAIIRDCIDRRIPRGSSTT